MPTRPPTSTLRSPLRVATATPWNHARFATPRTVGTGPIASARYIEAGEPVEKQLEAFPNMLMYRGIDNARRAVDLLSRLSPETFGILQDRSGRSYITQVSADDQFFSLADGWNDRTNIEVAPVAGSSLVSLHSGRFDESSPGALSWAPGFGFTRPVEAAARATGSLPGVEGPLVRQSWSLPSDFGKRGGVALAAGAAVRVGASAWDAMLGAEAIARFLGGDVAIVNGDDNAYWLARLQPVTTRFPEYGTANQMMHRLDDHVSLVLTSDGRMFDFDGLSQLLGT